ncbi:hypothetical protein B0H11DRAFT_1914413 [Mycena galericulata]|nr:hypothetical protein B0H11DRAFT_1914413 [Mycena galericulata]
MYGLLVEYQCGIRRLWRVEQEQIGVSLNLGPGSVTRIFERCSCQLEVEVIELGRTCWCWAAGRGTVAAGTIHVDRIGWKRVALRKNLKLEGSELDRVTTWVNFVEWSRRTLVPVFASGDLVSQYMRSRRPGRNLVMARVTRLEVDLGWVPLTVGKIGGPDGMKMKMKMKDFGAWRGRGRGVVLREECTINTVRVLSGAGGEIDAADRLRR